MLNPINMVPTLKDLDISDSAASLIGKGTFGVVNLAKSKKTNKIYALKIVDTSKLEKDDVFCIEREMKIQSLTNHPNIIRFYGHEMENKNIVMILEYASNGNLFAYIRKKRRLSESEAFTFFYQTALALNYLHQNDILHRDIKPENLLLDEKNNIKICDFGWSAQGISCKRNTFCGTYEYMSPEVVFKRNYNENIDIWALGILLYEMVHGRSPYKAKNLKEIKNKMISDNKIVFSNDISSDLINLITNILKMNPTERFTLKEIFEHSWVQRMYTFVNYKEKFEDNQEEKVISRETSVSLSSENCIDNVKKPIKSKTMEFDPIPLDKLDKLKENNINPMLKRKNMKIFEKHKITDSSSNVLKEMEIMMKNLEIITNTTKSNLRNLE